MRIKVIRPHSRADSPSDFQEYTAKKLQSWASPGTELTVVFPDIQANMGGWFGRLTEGRLGMMAPYVAQEAVKAEKEGYDAVYTTGEWDVGASIARHMVNIPVVDTGPVALHTAALLGDRICLLIIEDESKSFAHRLLRRWGMKDFVTSIVPWNIPVHESWKRRDEIKDLTVRLCRKAVEEEDAQVIVSFCAVFVPFIVSPEEVEAEVGVPVLNTMAIGIRTTETFVNLKIHKSQKSYPPQA
ncbi:MAG: hypothetical protein HY670_06705 [Chloroflexi bacterium]|nr:hypothetical protein [Chloroflexota bacterium]